MTFSLRGLTCLAATLSLCTVSSVVTTPTLAHAADEGAPCQEYIQQTQVIDGDTRPDGSPIEAVPGPGGKTTPVILVHGWTAHGAHRGHNPHKGDSQFSLTVDRVADGARGYTLPRADVHSSFVGMLQQIPGAAVYLFSYEEVNTHWVTDPKIGRRLADAIECLSTHYGTKAVVVGHSMGGLATREALSLSDRSGKSLADRVAHVVTFGTPNEGTELFQAAYDAMDVSLVIPGINVVTGIMRLILQKCSERADKTGTFCFGVGGPPDAMYTEGARAMLPHSAALAALPHLPQSVPYTALAGDIKLGGVSLFGYNSKRLLDLGDFAVPLDSAVSMATDKQVSTCEYGIAAIGGKRHHITVKDWFAGARTTSILTPFDKGREMATPCYHNNLMSELGLARKATAVIAQVCAHPESLQAETGLAESTPGGRITDTAIVDGAAVSEDVQGAVDTNEDSVTLQE